MSQEKAPLTKSKPPIFSTSWNRNTVSWNLYWCYSSTCEVDWLKQSPSVKRGVLRNFAKFPEKHMCQSLFFNKVAGLRPATLLKRDSTGAFCKFCNIFKNTYVIEHLRQLILASCTFSLHPASRGDVVLTSCVCLLKWYYNLHLPNIFLCTRRQELFQI